ncbi:hypothetical protein ACWDTI_15715 [Gordonia sp. NPDC003424]
MNSDTWTDRDLPVLSAVVEIYDQSGQQASANELASVCGLDDETVQRALRALYRGPYFEKGMTNGAGDVLVVGKPTSDALRAAGQWPSPETLLRRLIDTLQAAADDESRPTEERKRFQQIAGWLGSTAYQVAIGAMGGAGGNLLTG